MHFTFVRTGLKGKSIYDLPCSVGAPSMKCPVIQNCVYANAKWAPTGGVPEALGRESHIVLFETGTVSAQLAEV